MAQNANACDDVLLSDGTDVFFRDQIWVNTKVGILQKPSYRPPRSISPSG